MGLLDRKKRFLDMNVGVSKVTIAEKIAQNYVQKNANKMPTTSLDDRLVRILKAKTLGSEVIEVLKPKTQSFKQMTPLDYQSKLQNLIDQLQILKQKETRSVVKLIYQDAIRVLQAERLSTNLLEEFRIMLLQG